MTNPAAWIRHVTAPARNDVDVQVRDGLPGGVTQVDADVEAIGTPLRADDATDCLDRTEERSAFLGRRIEPGGDVPIRNDQRVALGNREAIPEREDVLET